MKISMIPHTYKLWLLSLVHQSESFSQAARLAGITQSALSQSMSSLENIFGETLLIRGRGRVQLTRVGADLLQKVEPHLEGLANISPVDDPGKRQEILLGAYDSIALSVLPRLLPALSRRFPLVDLQIRTARSGNLHELVRNGDLDLALAIGDAPRKGGIRVENFYQDYLGLYVSNEHPISDLGSAALAKVGVGTLSSPEGGYPKWYRSFARKFLQDVPIQLHSESFEILRGLACQGTIVAVLPMNVARRQSHQLKLIDPVLAQPSQNPSRHNLCLLTKKSIDSDILEFFSSSLRGLFGTN